MARYSPLWDAIVKEFSLATKTRRQQSRVAAVYADLSALGALPTEVSVRRRRLVELWGVKSDTPESLAKHWAKLADAPRTVIPGQPSRAEQAAMEREWAEQRARVEREQR